MPNEVTTTAPTGPGLAAAVEVFTNPSRVDFDLPGKVVHITDEGGKIHHFDLAATTTITATAASGVYTFTIEQ